MELIIQGNKEGTQLAVTKKGIAIIVDVLRASTTIPVAIKKGLQEIYVTEKVENTHLIQKEFNTIIMGERNCIKQPGFDFGNSPLEIMAAPTFERKRAAFTSSTGAKRVVESIGAKHIIIGSIVNAQAVAKKVIEINRNRSLPVIIIPAFSKGSIIENEITEDQLGGLFITRELKHLEVETTTEVNDQLIFLKKKLKEKPLYELLLSTEHGKKLFDLNFVEDIEFCSKLNILDIVPISNNTIALLSNGSKIVKFEKE